MRYYDMLAAAYYRGLHKRTGKPELARDCVQNELASLSERDIQQILTAGRQFEDVMYYFKRTHEELPRVRRALGFLHAVYFESVLDVGSGRGVFLLPFMEQFQQTSVTSLDILPRRAQFMQDISAGGIERLCALQADIVDMPVPEKSHDVVTMLEVLEHIPDVERAITSAVRIARRHVVLTAPSKPDDNPEHIHLLTKDALTEMFRKAGCERLRFDGVNGHIFMVATLND